MRTLSNHGPGPDLMVRYSFLTSRHATPHSYPPKWVEPMARDQSSMHCRDGSSSSNGPWELPERFPDIMAKIEQGALTTLELQVWSIRSNSVTLERAVILANLDHVSRQRCRFARCSFTQLQPIHFWTSASNPTQNFVRCPG